MLNSLNSMYHGPYALSYIVAALVFLGSNINSSKQVSATCLFSVYVWTWTVERMLSECHGHHKEGNIFGICILEDLFSNLLCLRFFLILKMKSLFQLPFNQWNMWLINWPDLSTEGWWSKSLRKVYLLKKKNFFLI